MDYDDLEPLHAELLRLEKQEPHDGRVLALLIDSSETLGDLQSLERTSVKYYRLLPDMPDAVLTLAEAYALNTKPILALKTYQRFLERWPDRTEVPTVLKKIEDLRPIVESMLKQYREITTEELDLASKHEEMQSLTAMGEVSQARHIGNALLKKYPTFAPALNNIAYSFAYEGNYREAIAAALRVLEFEPDNVHALANLIRYYSFMGERDRALPLGERLKTSQAPALCALVKLWKRCF